MLSCDIISKKRQCQVISRTVDPLAIGVAVLRASRCGIRLMGELELYGGKLINLLDF